MSLRTPVIIAPRAIGEVPSGYSWRHVRPAAGDDASNPWMTRLLDAVERFAPGGKADVCADGWWDCIPTVLRETYATAPRDCVNYLCAVIAVDFRHWVAPEVAGAHQSCLGRVTMTPYYARSAVVGSDSPVVRGSAGMLLKLKEAVDVHGLHWYRPEELLRLSPDPSSDVARLLFEGVDPSGVRPVMLGDTAARLTILRDIGTTFAATGHDFYDLLLSSEGRLFNGGRGFIERLVALHPRYRDSYVVDGTEVWVMKLAQLTGVAIAAALHGRQSSGSGDAAPLLAGPPFSDLDDLQVAADYQLPRGLWALGALEYDAGLAEDIRSSCIVPRGSRAEFELRAATIYVAKALLSAGRAAYGPHFTVAVVDNVLWRLGRALQGEEAITFPFHLTPTIMY